MKSQFETELNKHVDALRELLADAREEENDLAVESLIGELEGLVQLAERNDVDTGNMQKVLAVETGTIPIVEVEEDAR